MLRKILFLLLSACLFMFFSSCADNLTEVKDVSLIANAGNDQSIIAGSYALFNPTGSTGYYSWYEWDQDEKNPQKVKILSQPKDEKNNKYNIDKIVFTKPGVYRFYLTVMDKRNSGSSEDNYSPSAPDTLTITVMPNLNPTFEDLNLEAIVRAKLDRQDGPLDDSALSELDSLSNAEVTTQDLIQSLNGLEKCKNLERLFLCSQKFSDLSPLASLTKLKTLWINQNKFINDLSPLKDLTEMEDLDINSTPITDITPLSKMTKLKYLNCGFCPIKFISAVKNMTELIDLSFSFTSIKDLTPVSNLTKLECLWLTSCEISDISCIRNLTNLKIIKIAANKITDISALANMKQLERIYMELNNVTDISPLQNLPNLAWVRLWDNKVEDIEPLVNNIYLAKGDIISLTGNPLNDKSITTYIPMLTSREIIVYW